jgi:uncharacterized membrane protein
MKEFQYILNYLLEGIIRKKWLNHYTIIVLLQMAIVPKELY